MAEWSDIFKKGLAFTKSLIKALLMGLGVALLLGAPLLAVACGDSQEASKPTQQSSNETANSPSGHEEQPPTPRQLVQANNACPEWGTPALFKADVLQRCIDEGLNPNAKLREIPLLLAAVAVGAEMPGQDATEAVRVLLEADANVNARDKKGHSTLMLASGLGHTATVQALLEAGADVNAQSGDGRTALALASEAGHIATVQALLEAEADVNAQGGTALILAADKGHIATVQALLEAGADVNAQIGNGGTALILAADKGHTATVQALLEAGADLDLRDIWGSTAYSAAKARGHTEIMNMIEKIAAFR